MATIKDIAKLAGVSQGTVSNVLNKKENVSSEKIERVLKAAEMLDYTPNVYAKNLRKGYSKNLHLVIPNLDSKIYQIFYKVFKKETGQQEVLVDLNITNGSIQEETRIINEILPELNEGDKIAVVTSVPYKERYDNLHPKALDKIVFLLHDYIDSRYFISFDFEKIGEDFAQLMQEGKYKNIGLISNLKPLTNELTFKKGFNKLVEKDGNMTIHNLEIDPFRSLQSFLEFINFDDIEVFILTDFEYTNDLLNVMNNLSINKYRPVYAITPLYMFPEQKLVKYELNYQLFARKAIDLLKSKKSNSKLILSERTGIRKWNTSLTKVAKQPKSLNVLTVENPNAKILSDLATKFTDMTGIEIHVDTREYNDVYTILSDPKSFSKYDVIRNDINWMSWFASSIYKPINRADERIKQILPTLTEKLIDNYYVQKGQLYALPYSPSTQVLFYRKDLFERIDIKRKYKELYNENLTLPTSFDQFNRIARFFTKEFNQHSPTTYGATLTLGNTGVAGSEFLSRYYSFTNSLFISGKSTMNIDYDLTLKVLKQINELKNYTRPQDCLWWTDTATHFSQGDVAMSIMYSNYAPEFLRMNSKILGNIGHTIVPGNNALMGGGGIGVARYTKNPETALDFIVWLSQETNSSMGALLGNLPIHQQTFEYYDIIDEYPWFTTTYDSLLTSSCIRTQASESFKFNEKGFLSIIGKYTQLASTSKPESLEKLVDEIIDEINLNSDDLFRKSHK